MSSGDEDSDRLDQAVERNDLSTLKQELSTRQYPRLARNSALQLAARTARVECFRALLEAGSQPQSTDSRDRNTLHLVMRYGKGNLDIMHSAIDAIKQKTARNNLVNLRDKKGWTPLCYAAEACYTEAVELLLASGADVDRTSSYDRETPLMMAANKGALATIQVLLRHNANVNKKGLVHNTALSKAIQKKNNEVVKVLIDAGSNVNACDCYGHTPLIWAAESGAVDAARLLIEHGASVNTGDTAGRTPLYFASASQHTSMIDFLLSQGADVNMSNDSGVSPFLMAVKRGHVNIAKLLLSYGAHVDQRFCENGTALHMACFSNSNNCLKYLLHPDFPYRYPLDEPDEKGKTPLIQCCDMVCVDNVKTLLEHGADPDRPDRHDRTPISSAMRSLFIVPLQTAEVVRALVRFGCGINKRAVFDMRVLGLASDSRLHASPSSLELPFEMALRMGSAPLASVLWEAGSEMGKASLWASSEVPWYTMKEVGGIFQHDRTTISPSQQASVTALLTHIVQAPRSLAALARIKIRQHLGHRLESKAEQLGLPEAIKAYVNLPTLDVLDQELPAADSDSDADFMEEEIYSDTFSETSEDYSLDGVSDGESDGMDEGDEN